MGSIFVESSMTDLMEFIRKSMAIWIGVSGRDPAYPPPVSSWTSDPGSTVPWTIEMVDGMDCGSMAGKWRFPIVQGSTEILETPGLLQLNGLSAYTRTISIEGVDRELMLKILGSHRDSMRSLESYGIEVL